MSTTKSYSLGIQFVFTFTSPKKVIRKARSATTSTPRSGEGHCIALARLATLSRTNIFLDLYLHKNGKVDRGFGDKVLTLPRQVCKGVLVGNVLPS